MSDVVCLICVSDFARPILLVSLSAKAHAALPADLFPHESFFV